MEKIDKRLHVRHCTSGWSSNELLLRFAGLEQDGEHGARSFTLAPATAKALAERLRHVLSDYEDVHGTLWSEHALQYGALTDRRTGLGPDSPEQLTAHGAQMYGLLKNLPLNGFERSFKMQDRRLLTERFLLGIHRRGLHAEQLHALLDQLGMPSPYRKAFEQQLGHTNFIHFGHEHGPGGTIWKVYQEFPPAPDSQPEGASVPLYIGYKWDLEHPERRAISRYRLFRGLSAQQMLHRVTQVHRGRTNHAAAQAAAALVEFAARRSEAAGLLYVDVEEEGNPRLSYDINLYAAGLVLQDAEAILAAAATGFALPEASFTALWAQVRSAKLGHISGGIARDGQPFLTIYYAPQPAEQRGEQLVEASD